MKITPVFEEVDHQGDHGLAHICPDCAKLYSLATQQSVACGNGTSIFQAQ